MEAAAAAAAAAEGTKIDGDLGSFVCLADEYDGNTTLAIIYLGVEVVEVGAVRTKKTIKSRGRTGTAMTAGVAATTISSTSRIVTHATCTLKQQSN